MARKPYQTDLTDQQWKELQPLIPSARRGGRPRRQDMREVINGIMYVLRTGCAWRHMPHDLPNPKTCWFYFNRFSSDGTWRDIAEDIANAGTSPKLAEAALKKIPAAKSKLRSEKLRRKLEAFEAELQEPDDHANNKGRQHRGRRNGDQQVDGFAGKIQSLGGGH